MNIKDFKLGDTVICNTSFEDFPQKGWRGKIIDIYYSEEIISIEWEKSFSYGHSCRGLGEDKHCFN
jgi:hypothetical protein